MAITKPHLFVTSDSGVRKERLHAWLGLWNIPVAGIEGLKLVGLVCLERDMVVRVIIKRAAFFCMDWTVFCRKSPVICAITVILRYTGAGMQPPLEGYMSRKRNTKNHSRMCRVSYSSDLWAKYFICMIKYWCLNTAYYILTVISSQLFFTV